MLEQLWSYNGMVEGKMITNKRALSAFVDVFSPIRTPLMIDALYKYGFWLCSTSRSMSHITS